MTKPYPIGDAIRAILVLVTHVAAVRAACTIDFRGNEHCTTPRTWVAAVGIVVGLMVLISLCAYARRRRRLRLSSQLAFIPNNPIKPHQPSASGSQAIAPDPQSVQRPSYPYVGQPQSQFNNSYAGQPYSPPLPPGGSTYQPYSMIPASPAQIYPPPSGPPQSYPPPNSPPPQRPQQEHNHANSAPTLRPTQAQQHHSPESPSSRWSSFNPYSQLVRDEEPSAPMPMPVPSIPSQPSPSFPITPPPPAHTISSLQTPSTLTSRPSFTAPTTVASEGRNPSPEVENPHVPVAQITDTYSVNHTKGSVVLSAAVQPNTSSPSGSGAGLGSTSEPASGSGSGLAAFAQPQPIHPVQASSPPSQSAQPSSPPPRFTSPPPRVTSPGTVAEDPPPRYSEF